MGYFGPLAFLRVVEVLPPLFSASSKSEDRLAIDAKMERFTEEVRSIRNFADIIVVANVKNSRLLKIDSVHAAIMLQEFLRVEAAPVIVVRDMNRPQFLSTVLTAMSITLKSLMIAWGDDYPASVGTTNVRDYRSLAAALRDASRIRSRAHSSTRFLAPVDIRDLSSSRGASRARRRISSGADILVAQPPTTDARESFDKHASLIERAGLGGKVLLNVFPFKDEPDVKRYENMFGWKLPKSLHKAAESGTRSLLSLEKEVIGRLRDEGFPGVYLATGGDPSVAERMLA